LVFSVEHYFNIANQPQTAEANKSPGPAAYDQNIRSSAPAYTMGGNYRQAYNGDLSPGPNDYDVKIPWDKGVIFTKDRRGNGYTGKEHQPGPGQYEYNSQIGKGGVYMAGRYPEKAGDTAPGPGYYK
jgi:hypothetical protein